MKCNQNNLNKKKEKDEIIENFIINNSKCILNICLDSWIYCIKILIYL